MIIGVNGSDLLMPSYITILYRDGIIDDNTASLVPMCSCNDISRVRNSISINDNGNNKYILTQ